MHRRCHYCRVRMYALIRLLPSLFKSNFTTLIILAVLRIVWPYTMKPESTDKNLSLSGGQELQGQRRRDNVVGLQPEQINPANSTNLRNNYQSDQISCLVASPESSTTILTAMNPFFSPSRNGENRRSRRIVEIIDEALRIMRDVSAQDDASQDDLQEAYD